MSSRIELTLACGDYDINQGLVSGDVRPQGIDVTVLTYPAPERHWRMGRHMEFDVCEYGLSSFLMLHDRSPGELLAIPAFPHRRFRHSFIFVNPNAGITQPSDLNGRRIGLRNWQVTAGLWIRGILEDDYGLDPTSVDWIAQDEEEVPLGLPPGIRLARVDEGKTVTGMLLDGELDALIYPETPRAALEGDPRIARLFADPRREEADYFRRTRTFPIMHVVVLKRNVHERYPWVARNLLLAFRESKDLAFERMRNPRSISLAWLREAREEQERLMGPDPWNYSFAGSRHELETAIRYSFEQGLISRRFDPRELFLESTLDELPTYV